MNAILLLPAGIVLLNVFALVLVLLRAPLFRLPVYWPMVLNIGLSIAPAVVLGIGLVLVMVIVALFPNQLLLLVVIALVVVVWLLLLPNAAYLVTELNFSHRRPTGDPAPLWYDIVMVLALALSGVLNMLMNVLLVQFAYVLLVRPNDDDPYRQPDSWLLVALTLVLVSVGIYLGRYIRFNTWDLLHPSSFARKLVEHFRVPAHLRTLAGFVVVHAVFFAVLYLLVVAPVLLMVAAVSR
ncbi:putative membrane protein [Promicromonospora sp. AC04]|uniref:DUF1361 domain-containing protein n=1 Tax=Promicromonospora sp. AC04 TaxID=2135723 RepID=UPI000D36829C|nr:DUF1361 domain-containing protein [Promicromonospora sp. AC04]PUB25513.1 putative membrane protein [Promicromonospora sp. AC04]